MACDVWRQRIPSGGAVSRIVDIRRGEWARVALSFVVLMLTVGSYTVVKAVRDAVFLSKFGVTQLSFIAIGLAVLTSFVVSVYLRATGGVTRNLLIGGTNTVVAGSLAAIWLFLAGDPPPGWVPWVLYIWSSIFGVFTVMQFWLLANDLFDPREAKRLFGVVSAGAILGGSTGGYLSLALARSIGTRGLLLVAGGMLLTAAVLANIVWPMRRQESAPKKDGRKQQAPGRGFAVVRDHPYVRLIALALLLSTLATTLLDWQFKAIAKAHFANDRDGMTAYFGNLFFWLSNASFVLQMFVTGWLLRTFGVGIGLLILPLSLLVGSCGILFHPLLPFGRLSAATGAKVAEGGLRFAIDKASMELMWLPVPPRVKEQGKAFVDTVVDRLGTGLTGLLWLALAGAGVANGGRVHFVSIVVLVAVVAWLAVLLRARGAYVDAFRDTLVARSLDVDQLTSGLMDAGAKQLIEGALASDDPREVGFALYMLREMRASLPDLTPALQHVDPQVRCEALQLLTQRGDREQRKAAVSCLMHSAVEVREAAIVYLGHTVPEAGPDRVLEELPTSDPEVAFAISVIRLGAPDTAMGAADAIRQALAGGNAAQRPAQVRLIGGAPPEMAAALLAPLLRDCPDAPTVHAALRAAGRARATSLVPQLCQLLFERQWRARAAAALREMGEPAFAALRELAIRDDAPVEARLSAVRMLGASGDAGSAGALVDLALVCPHEDERPQLSLQAVRALVRMRSGIDLSEHSGRVGEVVNEILREVIRNLLVLDLGSYPAMRSAPRGDGLFERALRERVESQLNRVFLLLGLLYDPDDMRAALDAAKSSQRSRRASGIEFLDNLLQRPHKANLLPLLEVADANRLASIATQTVGATREGREQALKRMISGSDLWLRAVACWVVKDEGLQNLVEHLRPLSDAPGLAGEEARAALRVFAEDVKQEEASMSLTLVEKVLRLRTVDVLQQASSEELAQVAQISQEVDYEAGASIYAEGDAPDALFVVISGSVGLRRGSEEIGTVAEGEAFGSWALFDEAPRVASAVAVDVTRLLKVDRADFIELLADHVDITQSVFRALVARLRQLAEVVKGA